MITAKDLHARLNEASLVIVDTRFSLTDPQQGRRDYSAGHIPKAVYFDLDKDLSALPSEHGGRHPLPEWDAFVQKLEAAGIGNDSSVVVYDDSTNVFAGRLWWMLRYLGHKDVKVLDGSYGSWLKHNFPTSTTLLSPSPSHFSRNIQHDMLVGVNYVQRNLDNPTVQLMDARAPERYRGEVEPLDPKAGHIPGAINHPYGDNLVGAMYKPADVLAQTFASLELGEAEDIVVYCGSGVSANHTLIALEEAGIEGAKLYVGSWSDWSSYENNPVATGDEP